MDRTEAEAKRLADDRAKASNPAAGGLCAGPARQVWSRADLGAGGQRGRSIDPSAPTITEGKVRKGGINNGSFGPRPAPPAPFRAAWLDPDNVVARHAGPIPVTEDKSMVSQVPEPDFEYRIRIQRNIPHGDWVGHARVLAAFGHSLDDLGAGYQVKRVML